MGEEREDMMGSDTSKPLALCQCFILKLAGGYMDICQIFSDHFVCLKYFIIIFFNTCNGKSKGIISLYTQLISFIFLFHKEIFPFWSLNQQQAENQAKDMKNALDLAKQPSELEDGLSLLWTKLQRNEDQAVSVKAQAESAHRQAGRVEQVISPTTATKSRQSVLP